MKYLKKFELTSEYEAQKSSLPDPWVALTEDDKKVHYKDTIIYQLLLDYTNTVHAYSTESVINCSGVTVTVTSDGIVSSAVTTAYTETITYTENESETDTKVNSGTLTWNDAEAEYTITQDAAVYYTITFLNDDDTLIESGRYMETKSIVVPSDPSKEHYTFKGWTPEVSPTAVADATYTATYEIDKYTIKFLNDDSSVISEAVYDYNSDIVVPANPTKSGYIFKGWNPAVNTKAVADATYTATYEYIYKAVDLGLPSGRKWANINVGATTESDYGKYFQWGDTVGYTDASHSTWSTCPFNGNQTDYSATEFAKVSGTVCPNKTLALQYDAARADMGGNWRMPTTAEFQELANNTNNTWTTVNGVSGRRFTSKTNGNSIFMPASGYASDGSVGSRGSSGYMWSSSLDSSSPYRAYYMGFGSSSVYPQDNFSRYKGFSVRGVC